jgi:hypothetical protein
MSPPDFDEDVADVEGLGLLRQAQDPSGHSTWTLTAAGLKVARLMTMSQGDAMAVLDALLDARRRLGRGSGDGPPSS